jgi:signal transduction histidine kinase
MFNASYISINNIAVLIVLSFMGMLLKQKTTQYNFTQSSYIYQRDNLTEKSIALEHKIIELSEKQNNEISVATLNERNRIAREIHDNVGHLLSSSILQIAAVIATTKDENTKHSLKIVKSTLNDGMDSIRDSVHNLRDNSIDLFIQLKEIVDSFTFCNAILNYELSSILNVKAKYAVISIVKEALSNVIKHSNATELSVSLYEHPKLIQLIVLDNGSMSNDIYNNGMGIESIRQRVSSLNGILNINNSNGFRIFISFNKNDVEIGN